MFDYSSYGEAYNLNSTHSGATWQQEQVSNFNIQVPLKDLRVDGACIEAFALTLSQEYPAN